ncbi:hypothetical protein VTL71DRAFT_3521 [Oculimacula yallundae]|uniref:Uncharacterized protein n=1 Tax=Oculimacula yallundae TaxID=86028 RepID=A0ABR4C9A4_9HELO
MRRCYSIPKHGLLRSPVASIAARRTCPNQPFHTTAAREYSCLSRLLPSLRRPSRAIVSRDLSKVHNRFLNTEIEANVEIASSTFPTFAFAFDIDGVLLRSSKPLPGATEALLYLEKHNIPFILLTNGGGKLESERVTELSERLGVPLLEDNFVQSHTPFKGLLDPEDPHYVEGLKDKVVMVTGGDGDKCRRVAESYGFKHVVTPGDILMACPDIWPFSKNFTDAYNASCRPLPAPINPTDPANSLKIDAIFVFNDPRDWALDTQIIIDLLLSREGILGTVSDKNGNGEGKYHGYQQDGQPRIFFSNPDLLWASAYHMSRLGQGAFQEALIAVWRRVSGVGMIRTTIGKPKERTYLYAEKVLLAHRQKLHIAAGESVASPLSRVFMVGDNPASDIQGANNFKSEAKITWTSILVKSGVYQEGTKPEFQPKVIVDNVLDAVKWALKEQGWKGDPGKDEL